VLRDPQLHCWTPVVPAAVSEIQGRKCLVLLESVDHWSLTIPETQTHGGSRPKCSVVRRRCLGVRPLHPNAVCCSQPAPARASSLTCKRTGARELSGGNWMIVSLSPARWGCLRLNVSTFQPLYNALRLRTVRCLGNRAPLS
jgi:hypothetical protein